MKNEQYKLSNPYIKFGEILNIGMAASHPLYYTVFAKYTMKERFYMLFDWLAFIYFNRMEVSLYQLSSKGFINDSCKKIEEMFERLDDASRLHCALFLMNLNDERPSEEDVRDLARKDIKLRTAGLPVQFQNVILGQDDKYEIIPRNCYSLDNALQVDRTKKLKEMNTPLAIGTTDEIAKKYHLTKSEVRKMKREGTLEEFVKNHPQVA